MTIRTDLFSSPDAFHAKREFRKHLNFTCNRFSGWCCLSFFPRL